MKTPCYQYRDSHYKIRRFDDRLIIIARIHIPGKMVYIHINGDLFAWLHVCNTSIYLIHSLLFVSHALIRALTSRWHNGSITACRSGGHSRNCYPGALSQCPAVATHLKMEFPKVKSSNKSEAQWRIYASVEYSIIGSDIDMWPLQYQAIIWLNSGLIGLLGKQFSQISIKMQRFSSKEMRFEMSSTQCRPYYLGFAAGTRPAVTVITTWAPFTNMV